MQLPPLLQPWADWLTLFPEDLGAHVGGLLLRLSPVLGPLKRHAARMAVEPAGVGDIVQRGHFDRLLISEWAYAEAVPDEFIRRAANSELLFTGPEPASHDEALSSVAVFDAGPLQVGQPRLVHLAMLILLARRAELAGATFRWGLLHEPGVLRTASGKAALQYLLDSRTMAQPGEDAAARWNDVLDDTLSDGWYIGDTRSRRPPQLRASVTIGESWATGGLDVTLVQRRRTSRVALDLPQPPDCVRLLRTPFAAAAKSGKSQIVSAGAHSLKEPPYFGTMRQWVAVRMANGSTTIYHVPDSPNVEPGRPRRQAASASPQSVVATALIGKAVATVSRRGRELSMASFPGDYFKHDHHPHPATLPEQCDLAPGTARPARALFLYHRRDWRTLTERVFIVDKQGRMFCWTRTGNAGSSQQPTNCELVAQDVIGVLQMRDRIIFATANKGKTAVYALANLDVVPHHLYSLPHGGNRFVFGCSAQSFALETSSGRWLAGEAEVAVELTVDEGAEVIGCSISKSRNAFGLVVLHPGRKRIDMVTPKERQLLVDSAERVAQASFDPFTERLAWLGHKSGALVVRSLRHELPLLRTIPAGGVDA